MSSPESSPTKDDELKQILMEVERSLCQLQQRHGQVKLDLERRSQLLERQQELKAKQADNLDREPLKTELRHIQKELNRLDIDLESGLLPDIFWQVVRFVFLGIIIGWFLHYWVA